MPPVQIRDMKIQKTFDDLVLGTFGRSFWVLDDIGPFRAYAKVNYTKKEFDIVSVTPAYLSERRSYQGIRFIAQAEFQGDNKRTDATYSIWLKPEENKKEGKGMISKSVKKANKAIKEEIEGAMKDKDKKGDKKKKAKKDKLTFNVIDAKGDTVRTFTRKVDKKGLMRTSWYLESDGVRGPSRREAKKDADQPGGAPVFPGTYKMVISYGDQKDSIMTTVSMDPRVEMTEQDLKSMVEAGDKYAVNFENAKEAFDRVKKAKKSIALIEKLNETLTDSTKTEMVKLTKETKEKLDVLEHLFFDKQGLKGIQRNPNNLNSILRTGRRYLGSSYGAPNANAQIAMKKGEQRAMEVIEKVNAFMSKDWAEYQEAIKNVEFDLFKD